MVHGNKHLSLVRKDDALVVEWGISAGIVYDTEFFQRDGRGGR